MQQKENKVEVLNDETFIPILQKVIIDCDGYFELKDYITNNKPSFKLVQSSFQIVVDLDNNKEKFGNNVQKVLEDLINNKVQRIFMRVFFQYLLKNKDEMNLIQFQNNGIVQIWKDLQIQDLLEFIELFQLQEQITENQFIQHFKDLLYKRKYEDAYLIYSNLKLPKNCFDKLIEQMGFNHEASRAAEFIKQQNCDPAEYPKIVERLEKKCVRYLYKEHPWYKSEEMLLYQPQLLVLFCEEVYYNGQAQVALTIIKRNNLINQIKNQIQKEQMLKDLQEGFEEIPNILFTKDEFKPTEEVINDEIGVYLHCKDFGYPENQIILIDKVDENYFDAWKCIHSSNAVGFDCEFVTPWSKLDLKGFKVCLVQIATTNHAFLFDYQKLKDTQEFQNDVRQLLENDQIPKIGLSLKDDLKYTVKYLKLKNIIVRSIIELSNCFKLLEGESKNKSLGYISEFYFKKKLSKYDTCSNWEYRPLRKAQMHYAALDAIISLQIYLTMKEKNKSILEQEKEVLSLG